MIGNYGGPLTHRQRAYQAHLAKGRRQAWTWWAIMAGTALAAAGVIWLHWRAEEQETRLKEGTGDFYWDKETWLFRCSDCREMVLPAFRYCPHCRDKR